MVMFKLVRKFFFLLVLVLNVFAVVGQKTLWTNVTHSQISTPLSPFELTIERSYVGKIAVSLDSSTYKKYLTKELVHSKEGIAFQKLPDPATKIKQNIAPDVVDFAFSKSYPFEGFKHVPNANYPISKIDVNENLFNNSITSLCEDSRGAMWVAYASGEVSIITGNQINTYTHKQGFPHDFITEIESYGKNMLIATFGNGLYIVNQRSISNYNMENGFPSDHITAICEDEKGDLWLGTFNSGIIRIHENEIIHYENLPGGISPIINDLEYDTINHDLWGIDDQNHLFKIDEDHNFHLVEYLDQSWKGVAIDISCGKTVKVLYDNNAVGEIQSQVMNVTQINEDFHAVTIYEAPSSNVWLGSSTGEIAILYEDIYYTIDKSKGGPSMTISGICNDQHGNIWLNTFGEGIFMTSPSNFRSIANKSDSFFKPSGVLTSDENLGVLAFESALGGISLMQDNYLVSNYRHSLLSNLTGITIANDHIWATNSQGIYELVNDSLFVHLHPKNDGVNNCTGIKSHNDQIIFNNYNFGWLIHDLNTQKWFRYDGIQSATLTSNTFIDSKGRSWFSSPKGGLFYTQDEERTEINSSIFHIIGFTEDSLNNIYVGTSEGLYRFTTNENLQKLNLDFIDDQLNIRSICYQKSVNSLWLGTTKGLILVDLSEDEVRQFTDNLGINGNYFSRNALGQLNNRTYWSTNEAIVEFTPYRFKLKNSAPKIQFQSILLNYKQVNFSKLQESDQIDFDSITDLLPYGLQLTEDFSTITFKVGTNLWGENSGIEYFYALDEDEWTGPTQIDEITLSNLSGGKHQIWIKAVTKLDQESNIINYEFEVILPIYKQSWFLVIISVALIGLAIVGYLLRSQISFKRFEAYSNYSTYLSRLQFLSGLFIIGFPIIEWSNYILNETGSFRWDYTLLITTITLIFFISTFVKNISQKVVTYFAIAGSSFIVIVLINRAFDEHLIMIHVMIAIIAMMYMVIVYNNLKYFLFHFLIINIFFITKVLLYHESSENLYLFISSFVSVEIFSFIFHFFQINKLKKIAFSERILNTYDKLVLVYNDKGDVVYVNPYLKNFVNKDDDEILGENWYRIRNCDTQRTKEIKKSISNQIEQKETINDLMELIYSVPLQEERHISWTFQVLGNSYLMTIGNDVTESYIKQQQIEEAHKIIEQKNKDIVDSINYALRIQQSLLPNLSILSKTLPEHFMFYRPKDIVSGDFYYVETMGTKIFIGIVDCTGHGVPGAMMTSIGSAALNNAILDKRISDPGQILTYVDSYLKASLSINKDGVTDGMDMALLVINVATKELEFCGAKRPLITFNAEGKMQTYNGVKRSIGEVIMSDDTRFVTQTIPLDQELYVYAFSDGVTDQFGGPNGKKIYLANLVQLLEKHHQLRMNEQLTFINEYIMEWMGESNPQTDDMVMFGAKITPAYLEKMARFLT